MFESIPKKTREAEKLKHPLPLPALPFRDADHATQVVNPLLKYMCHSKLQCSPLLIKGLYTPQNGCVKTNVSP